MITVKSFSAEDHRSRLTAKMKHTVSGAGFSPGG